MKDLITPGLDEVRKAVNKLKLFTIALDSLIVFILSAIFLLLLGVEIILAVAPTLIYFILRLILVVGDRKIMKKIIRRHPSLNERLQTAYDNRGASNLIVDRLITGVSQSIDNIPYSSFVGIKNITLKVFMIIFLLFALLTINFFHINELSLNFQRDLRGLVGNSPLTLNGDDKSFIGDSDEWKKSEEKTKNEENKIGGESGGKLPGFGEGPIPGMGGGAGEAGDSDIYGAPSSARIEGQNREMEVHPEYGGEIEIKDVKEERLNAGEFKLPEEIKAASTPEQEPVEYEEVIRKYFEKLSREG